MKMRLLALCVVLGVPLTVEAAAPKPKPPAVVKARCAVCHGDAGESAGEDFPRLSGQHETYLAKQLRDFQSGNRTGLMVCQAKGLSDAEITAIARYYAAQPVPAPTTAPSEKAVAGRSIYLNGKPASGVPACMACHGEAAHGTPQLPRLAGQYADYLERQLKDFNLRKRTNDNAVMHEVAENLTPAEMRAVAEYLASLR